MGKQGQGKTTTLGFLFPTLCEECVGSLTSLANLRKSLPYTKNANIDLISYVTTGLTTGRSTSKKIQAPSPGKKGVLRQVYSKYYSSVAEFQRFLKSVNLFFNILKFTRQPGGQSDIV